MSQRLDQVGLLNDRMCSLCLLEFFVLCPGSTVAIGDRPLLLVSEAECYWGVLYIPSMYFCANWVEVNSTTYKPSNVVVLEIGDNFPKLRIVLGIFVVGANRIVLHIDILITEGHAYRYHGFIVKRSNKERELISLNGFFNLFPLNLHHLQIDDGTLLLMSPSTIY